MKLAIVNQPFGTIDLPWTGNAGSIDIWVYEVARRLAQTNDVIVYTRRKTHQKKTVCDQEVQYRHLSTIFDEWYTYLSQSIDKLDKLRGSHNIRHAFFLHNVTHPLIASKIYYFFYALQIAKDLKRENCELVHLINFSQFAPIIRMLNPKIKIVLNMTCEWLTQFNHKLIKNRLNKVDLIIGCSNHITRKIRSSFPAFAKRCTTTYNGVDTHQFNSEHDANNLHQKNIKRVLFVGRVSPEKGLHILLNAFQKVVKKHPETQLDIVGAPWQLPLEFLITLSNDPNVLQLEAFYAKPNKSYFSYLQRQLRTLKIENAVNFRGFVSHKKIVTEYQSTDILVNPSLSEAFGMSLIEAMACKVPIIATRVGGMTEIVDEKTGILVEPNNAIALAEATLNLLLDDGLRNSMGTAGRQQVVEGFSWEKIVEELGTHYKKL